MSEIPNEPGAVTTERSDANESTEAKKVTLNKRQNWKMPMGVLAVTTLDDPPGIIVGCMDGVYRVDLDSGEEERLYEHESYVSSVAMINERTIVSAGYDGRLCWFDLEKREPIRSVAAHAFWSWDMCVSPDRNYIATVTGQYLAGGYKYEPQPESEPSLKVFAAESGELVHALPHVPSTQAVAICPNSQRVAAGNLMGEVRVFDLASGDKVANWTTSDFTSWGIIKSHCYLGGIFDMKFTPDRDDLLLCGMGPMRDPMAGNGRQLWQRWNFRDAGQPKMSDQTHKNQSGEGLMESLAVHAESGRFAMGGRLRGGDWNLALFDLETGEKTASAKTGFRVTQALFSSDGKSLIVVGTQGQPKDRKDNGSFPKFGRVEVYEVG